MFLKDLEIGAIEKDTIIWLSLFAETWKIQGLNLAAIDKNKEQISLVLYNQMRNESNLKEI